MSIVDELAAKLNVLINSKPRSPTLDELKEVCDPYLKRYRYSGIDLAEEEDEEVYTYRKPKTAAKTAKPVTPATVKAKFKPIPIQD